MTLQAIGVLGTPVYESLLPSQFDELLGRLDQSTRELASTYLRNATPLVALMEATRDVVGGRFTVAGGSSIMTDGEYFWRLDFADYVEEYGAEIDSRALRHMRALNWQAPSLPGDDFLTHYREIDERYFNWPRET